MDLHLTSTCLMSIGKQRGSLSSARSPTLYRGYIIIIHRYLTATSDMSVERDESLAPRLRLKDGGLEDT